MTTASLMFKNLYIILLFFGIGLANKLNSADMNSISTSSSSSWIVHLHSTHTHDEAINSLMASLGPKADSLRVKHRWSESLHALVIEGDLLSITELEKAAGVKHVAKDSIKRLPPHVVVTKADTYAKSVVSAPSTTSSSSSSSAMKERAYTNVDLPWGIDSLDGGSVNGMYKPHWTGAGVDVYILDTGLDCKHIEFTDGINGDGSRVVKNIYNAFAQGATSSTDTDGHGHGTHVAGTIGGRYVGVAPGANLFGVKTLGDDGEALTSDIITAIEWVMSYRRRERAGAPSIVTMSLGGACDNDDCSKDSLVMSVQALTNDGYVVSVASGNENCNACHGSPNAAASAINVGAFQKGSGNTFTKASFSDYGQCIDMLAPGVSIVSAASARAKGNNGAEDAYFSMSGTSMACPHVTGVIAQQL